MPLKIQNYLELARNARNLAREACDEKSRESFLAIADDFDRKAKLRMKLLKAFAEDKTQHGE